MSTEDRELDRLERLARRMDSLVRLPGTRIRIGADSLIGLIPGIGDALAMAPALHILQRGHARGLPRGLLFRMGGNIAIDTVVGAVPIIGDIFDIGWKGNIRNVKIMRQYLENRDDFPEESPLHGRDVPIQSMRHG